MDCNDTLSKAWTEYEKKVDALAERMFKEVVRPICVKRGWKFLPGNGGWWIGSPDQRHSLDSDSLPDDDEWQAVCAVLETEIPGMQANDLGSLMPDYNP